MLDVKRIQQTPTTGERGEIKIMEIQEVLNRLSVISSEINDIKMEKIRGELSGTKAKKKAALVLKEALKENFLASAVEEWKGL
jgi:hypothetical protein